MQQTQTTPGGICPESVVGSFQFMPSLDPCPPLQLHRFQSKTHSDVWFDSSLPQRSHLLSPHSSCVPHPFWVCIAFGWRGYCKWQEGEAKRNQPTGRPFTPCSALHMPGLIHLSLAAWQLTPPEPPLLTKGLSSLPLNDLNSNQTSFIVHLAAISWEQLPREPLPGQPGGLISEMSDCIIVFTLL